MLRQLTVKVTRGESSTAQQGNAPERASRKRKYDVYHKDRAIGEHLFVPKLKVCKLYYLGMVS